jgi:hypothetical protein
MKTLIALMVFVFSAAAHAGNCTTISRTNFSPNTVIRSSEMNSQLNAIYAPFASASGALDGGCISDGTVEAAALNSADFPALYYGITQGCLVSYSDANTLSVGKCIASVNGFLIKTTSANTVTWACSSCSAEAASTVYYLYIKTGSTGTTLNLLISTTSPNEDGYDNSGNKVLARFFNNASSNIDQYSLDQWHTNELVAKRTEFTAWTPTFTGFGTVTTIDFKWRRNGDRLEFYGTATAGTVTAAQALISLPTGLVIDSTKLSASINTIVGNAGRASTVSTVFHVIATGGESNLKISRSDATGSGALSGVNANVFADNSGTFSVSGSVPIVGWK